MLTLLREDVATTMPEASCALRAGNEAGWEGDELRHGSPTRSYLQMSRIETNRSCRVALPDRLMAVGGAVVG
jgi:hypothetical protein